MAGNGSALGKAVLKAAALRMADGGPSTRFIGTEQPGGRVNCKFCGCRVRSTLGNVCSKRKCQQLAVLED